MEIKKKQFNFSPQSGQLLISEPFLLDENFRKAVILLCEHEEQGSVGFVLNRFLNIYTDEIIPGLLNHNFKVYDGGPVEQNTLHFIHKLGAFIPDSFPVSDTIFWGGNIEMINDLIASGAAKPNDFRFFMGYSGWGEEQLNLEIEQKAWWLTSLKDELVFNENTEEIWPACVRSLGADFAYLADSPEDYNWN